MAKATTPSVTKRKMPLWRRLTLGVLIAAVVLIATGVGLRYWITSDGGRGFIVMMLNGKRVPGLGAILIEGLKGDPLKAATFADIALVDDDGPWLRATNARLEWTPEDLFSGNLTISAIDIERVRVLRRPKTERQAQRGGSSPDVSLALDHLTIEDLRLTAGVLGPEATFKVAGAASSLRNAGGFAKLDLTPRENSADAASAQLSWTPQGDLTGQLTASGAPGGALSTLVAAPTDQTVKASAHVRGSIMRFNGEGWLAFGDKQMIDVKLARRDNAITGDARLHAEGWPLLDQVSKRAGDNVQITAAVDLADPKKAAVRLAASAPAGDLSVEAAIDIDQRTLAAPARVVAKQVDVSKITDELTGRLDADGQFRLLATGMWGWTGNASIDRFTFPGGAAAKVAGPISVSQRGSVIGWEARRLIADGGRISALSRLAPARYEISSAGEVNLNTRRVALTRTQLRGAPGQASARGEYVIATGAMDLTGAAEISRLADFAPLTGSGRGQWAVKRANQDAPWRITANLTGRNVGSTNDVLAALAGDAPRVEMAAVYRNGRFVVESGRVDSDTLEARMTGRISDAGAVTASANGRLKRALDLAALHLDALAFTANVSGDIDAPAVEVTLAEGAGQLGGMRLTNIDGEGQLRFARDADGRVQLTASADGQLVAVSGRVQGRNGAWTISALTGRLGGVRVTAPRLSIADGGLDAQFTADGSLAGLYGIEDGQLQAQGVAAIRDGATTVSATGDMRNLRRGIADLDRISFAASIANRVAKVDARIVGDVGVPLDAQLVATGQQAAQGWAGDARLTGTLDTQPITTPTPIAWSIGDGWGAKGALGVMGGRIDADLDSSPGTSMATLAIAGVDLRSLTRVAQSTPITGKLSGEARFSHTAGVAGGQINLSVADLNPVGATSASAVKLDLTAALINGQIAATAKGAGAGFQLVAETRLRANVGDGFSVGVDMGAPITGTLDLDGRAEQLWTLFGPEGQSLRGRIVSKITLAGTPRSPLLDGGFTVAEGAYEHGETGFRLRAIAAEGRFDQRSFEITKLSATDGARGRLTGDGKLDWEGQLKGAIRFQAADLRALGREDRSAIVSGEGALAVGEDAVRITGALNVQEARVSVEQAPSASIPSLPGLRRINFPEQKVRRGVVREAAPVRPVLLDLKITAPRRIVVFGRGLDTEWSADFQVSGPIANPVVSGDATLVRGDLDLGGRRFEFDAGSIHFDGPIRTARVDFSAERQAEDIDARVRVTGTPTEPKFVLESTPSLPQDEILARVLFGRSASELSALEAAQLAAALTQLAGGQAGFDPAGLLRNATGLDRVSIGASGGVATVSAGKYIAEDVYLQVGADGARGVGAAVEWEPKDGVSVTSSTAANGDSRIAVRWKKEY